MIVIGRALAEFASHKADIFLYAPNTLGKAWVINDKLIKSWWILIYWYEIGLNINIRWALFRVLQSGLWRHQRLPLELLFEVLVALALLFGEQPRTGKGSGLGKFDRNCLFTLDILMMGYGETTSTMGLATVSSEGTRSSTFLQKVNHSWEGHFWMILRNSFSKTCLYMSKGSLH